MTPEKYFKRNRWRVLVPTECLKNRNFGDIMLENRYQIEQKIKTTIIQTGHKSIHKKFPENPDRHFSIDISKFFFTSFILYQVLLFVLPNALCQAFFRN